MTKVEKRTSLSQVLALAVVAAIGLPAVVHADVLTWSGATNGNWDDVSTDLNWNSTTTTGVAWADGNEADFTDALGGTINVNATTTTANGVAPTSVNFLPGGGGNGNYTFNDTGSGTGGITGSASVTVASGYAGTVILNGANTYTGGTIINGGTLHAGVGSLGSGNITLGGGTFQTTSSSSSSTYSQNFIVTSGTTTSTIVPGASNSNPAFNGVFTSSAGATATNTVLNLGLTTQTITAIHFASDNTATPASSFVGTVSLGSGGFMRVSTGSPTAIFNLGNGTANLLSTTGGFTMHLGALEGGATTVLSSLGAGSGNITYAVGELGLATTFNGTITNSSRGHLILQIVGGSLTLTNGGSTYASNPNSVPDTIVSSGALYLNNASGSATGPSAVEVDSGTLGGVGFTNGAIPVTLPTDGSGVVTVNQIAASSFSTGGHIAPGTAGSSAGSIPGTLTLSTGLTLNDFSNLDFTLNGASTSSGNDLIATGNLVLPASGLVQVNLNITGGTPTDGSTYELISYTGTLTGDPSGWTVTGLPAGVTAAFSAPGNGQVDVTFSTTSSVPEPASLGLLGLGAVALLRRRRASR